MALAELFRSFADLFGHFDPALAREHGLTGIAPGLPVFDADRGRQHAAAFRSLTHAVEGLELDSKDEELDRTILLTALRRELRRAERDGEERIDPVLWTSRLEAALADAEGDRAILAALPAWVDAAVATIARPPLFRLQVSLDQLSRGRHRLTAASWWQSDKDALSAANAALERLEQFLRHEIDPDPEPTAGALGEAAAEWLLHHAFLIELAPGEALRHLGRRIEALEGRAAAGRSQPERSDPRAIPPLGGSTIRRELVAPAWARGWASFVATLPGVADDPARGLRAAADQARLGGLDLAIAVGRIGAAEGVGRLGPPASGSWSAVRIEGLFVHPLADAAAALLGEEWERTRSRWSGDDAGFVRAVTAAGVLHPALAAWGLELDG